MSEQEYTADEMMTVAAARQLHDGITCFVGIGLPSTAAILARATHAPGCVLIYESGTIATKPDVLPLSIGDGELAETADAVVSVPEVFNYWLQAGRVDVGFLGAAQIDRAGNLNTTVIGPYPTPTVRLPGAGGAPEIASSAKQVVVVLRHSPRAFVERVGFITSAGPPSTVITDLGLLTPHPQTRELVLSALHPGVVGDDVIQATGWDLQVADDLARSDPPTATELHALRALHRRTAEANR